MYEIPEENDGYKAMEIYMAKLNPKYAMMHFFQYPKKHWKYDEVWYDARPISSAAMSSLEV